MQKVERYISSFNDETIFGFSSNGVISVLDHIFRNNVGQI